MLRLWNKTIKLTKKHRLILVCYLFIFLFFLTAFQTIKVRAIDDNYSTYLYNQDINVDNDKAHLLTENSDGSNSYRNLFQSDFLFPAKLQNNMLSTQATSTFSHYSFNQFYFDNLNHEYNYQNSNPVDNLYQDVDFENDYDLEVGNSLRNGSIDDIGYNATYTFDNYNETESNYGNYSGTYSFDNDIELDDFFKTINENNTITIEKEIYNHKKVLCYNATDISIGLGNSFDNQVIGSISYWYLTDNTNNLYSYLLGGSTPTVWFRFQNGNIYAYNGSSNTLVIPYSINTWYYIQIDFDCTSDSFDLYINGNLECDNWFFRNSKEYINYMKWYSGLAKGYIDGLIYSWNNDINDNTNPYGLQTELENDFEVDYDYGVEYYINETNSNYNNQHITKDLTDLSRTYIIDDFTSQENGFIEFNIQLNETDKMYRIFLKNTDNDYEVCILFYGNDIALYNASNIIELMEYEANIKYHIKIYFDSNTQLFDVYVDNVLKGNDILYRYGNSYNIQEIMFSSWNSHSNYEIILDNIDYSWSIGYYENRITELNGHKFESEIESEHTVILYPNFKGMDTGWNPFPSGSEISCVDDTNDQSDYIYTNTLGKTILFEFQDLTSEFDGYNFNIDVVYTLKGTGASVYTTIHYYGAFSDDATSSFVNISRSKTVSYAQVNAMYISFASLSVPSTLQICSVFMIVHYSFNYFKVSYEQEFIYDYNLPITYELLYLLQTDTSLITDFSIYNYDLEQYSLFNSLDCYENYDLNSFQLNESSLFRFNKVKIQLNISHSYYSTELILDYLILRITYVVQNNEGYQEIILYNHRYETDNSYKGYSKFELQIYKDFIKYRYSEINFETDDYIYAWIEYNTSNIEVKNIELQSHIRYGLNTLDVEIINFYYIIYINYDYKIEFREQSRKELTTHKIKSSFNYTSYTKNYLDLTGIIGNYSYNCFNGMRSLYGSTSEIFHREFQIPFFSQDIDVSIQLDLTEGSGSNPSEPTPPTEYFWSYESFDTEYYQTVYINVGNWSIEFKQMRSTTITAKYYYTPESISKSDLGSWKWKIKFSDIYSYTIDFNFMRNALRTVLNLVLMLTQYFFFLIVASLSYVFMFIGTNILVFLWNYMIYYIFIGLITVLWFIYEGLSWLLYAFWDALLWIYEVVLIPAYIWFSEVAVPYFVEFILIPTVAFILTLLIWIITLGRLDFWELYDIVEAQLFILSDGFNIIVLELIEHIVVVVIFVALYLLLIFMCYLKHIVVKVRGYVNRSNALEESLNAYLYPIILFYKICLAIKQLIANWF